MQKLTDVYLDYPRLKRRTVDGTFLLECADRCCWVPFGATGFTKLFDFICNPFDEDKRLKSILVITYLGHVLLWSRPIVKNVDGNEVPWAEREVLDPEAILALLSCPDEMETRLRNIRPIPITQATGKQWSRKFSLVLWSLRHNKWLQWCARSKYPMIFEPNPPPEYGS